MDVFIGGGSATDPYDIGVRAADGNATIKVPIDVAGHFFDTPSVVTVVGGKGCTATLARTEDALHVRLKRGGAVFSVR